MPVEDCLTHLDYCRDVPQASFFTLTKPVESLYRIVMAVLTPAMPVDSLWSSSKPVLTTALPVEYL